MIRNSTIVTKKKKLACGCFAYAFSKNMCKQHASLASFNKRMDKHTEKELQTDNLKELVKDADEVVSLYVRLRDSDENGYCTCFTCKKVYPYPEMDAGHYIGRANMLLRFDADRNIKSQCKVCNQSKGGALAKYSQNLEKEKPGLPDILMEESLIVYKMSRDELLQIITEYKAKVKALKKNVLNPNQQ